MALYFEYKKVADWEAASVHPCYPNEWHPIGNTLVWLSMVCGYNRITEQNVSKIAQRLMEYQLVTGPLLQYQAPGEDGQSVSRKLYIDEHEVRRYIGLTTNSSTMTDREWDKHLRKIISDKVNEKRFALRDKPKALDQFAADCANIKPREADKELV